MRHPCQRFKSRLSCFLIALSTLVFAQLAHSAVTYRWVDKQGKTHFGDKVPGEYKGVAKPVDSKVTAPTAAEQRLAIERAAEQKAARAALESKRVAQAAAAAAAAASAPTAPTASSPTVPKRPARAPTEDTDCETWRGLYRESLDCFGPYRTAHGASKAQAFDFCTPVVEPPPRCGRNAP
jgi:Domain of unknown function (DUF4124)